ncbi:MAG: metallophosphatase [Bacteroidetes bacterium HGW-Bacteroidetes-20]|nr:MAG: metallophosphatase [Bacteroidetes bacterium HGW-Bacteroidetes-20]
MKNVITLITLFTALLIINILGFAQSSIVILHTNDTHSQIDPFMSKSSGEVGGVLRRYNYINDVRSKNPHVLLLDAGDFSQGTPFYNFFKGETEITLMNMMGYDVVTLGNHEFDNGSAMLAKQLKKADFKVVCANYNFKNKKLRKIVKPYTIITYDSVKIGIFGLTTDLKGLVSPQTEKELSFLDPVVTAKKIVQILKEKEHCDIIICLSHLGLDQIRKNDVSDKMLAEQVVGIDFIIGGHSHDYLETPLIINNIQIFQTGAKGAFIGKIELKTK